MKFLQHLADEKANRFVYEENDYGNDSYYHGKTEEQERQEEKERQEKWKTGVETAAERRALDESLKAPDSDGSFADYLRDINLAVSQVFNRYRTVEGAAEALAKFFGGNEQQILKCMQDLNINDESLNQHGWVTLSFSLNLFEKAQTMLPTFTKIGQVVQAARPNVYRQKPQAAYQTWLQNKKDQRAVSVESSAEGARVAEDQEFVLYDWLERTFDLFGDDYGDAIEALEKAKTNDAREKAYQKLMEVVLEEIKDDLEVKYEALTEVTYEEGHEVTRDLSAREQTFVDWYEANKKDGFTTAELEAQIKKSDPDRYALWQHLRRNQILTSQAVKPNVDPESATLAEPAKKVKSEAEKQRDDLVKNLEGKTYSQIRASAKLTKLVQQFLQAQGYELAADGAYGPQTRNKVAKLQAKLGVVPDGKFGPQTLVALKSNPGATEMIEQRVFNSLKTADEASYKPTSNKYLATKPAGSGRGYHANMDEIYEKQDLTAPAIGAENFNGAKIYQGLQDQLVKTGDKTKPAMQRVHETVKEFTGVALSEGDWAQAWSRIDVVDGKELKKVVNTNRFIGNTGERLAQLKDGDPVFKLSPVVREVKDASGKVIATARFQAYMREDCSNPIIVMDQFELKQSPAEIAHLLPEEVVGSEHQLNLTPIIVALISGAALAGATGGAMGSKEAVNALAREVGGGLIRGPIPPVIF